jgi:flagellar protein FlaI
LSDRKSKDTEPKRLLSLFARRQQKEPAPEENVKKPVGLGAPPCESLEAVAKFAKRRKRGIRESLFKRKLKAEEPHEEAVSKVLEEAKERVAVAEPEEKRKPTVPASKPRKRLLSFFELKLKAERRRIKKPRASWFQREEKRKVKLKAPTVTPFCTHAEIAKNIQVLDIYELVGGAVKVTVADDAGKGLYLLDEPRLLDVEVRAYSRIIEALQYELPPPETDELAGFIEEQTKRIAEDYGLETVYRLGSERLLYYVKRDILGYGPIHALKQDPNIEDIRCEGPNRNVRVWHRQYGQYDWLATNIILNEDILDSLIFKLAHMAGKHVSSAFPVVDAALPDGDRLNILFQREVTTHGSAFVIRRFRPEPYTVSHLLSFGTLSLPMAAYLWFLVENKMPIIAIGATGSGKTTTINALAILMKPSWTCDTVEDTPELNLPLEGWEALVSRHTYALGEKADELGLFDLLMMCLRRRPDVIIVGEIRGTEAYALFQALGMGHGGFSTIHADSVDTTVKRLTQPPLNVSPQLIPMMKAVCVVGRIEVPGTGIVRRITEVTEVLDYEKYNTVFTWKPVADNFQPSTIEELLQKSMVLRKSAKDMGHSLEDLKHDLERRMQALNWMVKNDVKEFLDVAAAMRLYYSDPNRFIERAEAWLKEKKAALEKPPETKPQEIPPKPVPQPEAQPQPPAVQHRPKEVAKPPQAEGKIWTRFKNLVKSSQQKPKQEKETEYGEADGGA